MESTLQKTALVAAKTTPKAKTIVYWIVTALFCLQISFTAYAQLRLPQVAEAFTHLGFPAYFRVELSWAKLLGVGLGGGHRRALGALVLLLAPPAGHAGERLTAHHRLFGSTLSAAKIGRGSWGLGGATATG
jgi:hypothetical protein